MLALHIAIASALGVGSAFAGLVVFRSGCEAFAHWRAIRAELKMIEHRSGTIPQAALWRLPR